MKIHKSLASSILASGCVCVAALAMVATTPASASNLNMTTGYNLSMHSAGNLNATTGHNLSMHSAGNLNSTIGHNLNMRSAGNPNATIGHNLSMTTNSRSGRTH